ncbi:helix-turn-helix transcriptional regulator [Micromonospora sp. FIMYZ51]|uniref:helix-turn-helix domain-containing protein n=1 Tax=Micromonospora sp. FIMYZ51 TaxID=3051832 RepID=UPI00311FBD1E
MTTTSLPRPRVHTCQRHRRYQAGCPGCQQRTAESARNRTRLAAYSQWDRALIDTTPARNHITQLQRHGMSRRAIADAAGVSPSGIDAIANGQRARAAQFTVDAICGVRPRHTTPTRRVPAHGATRRLQALTLAGWPTGMLADRLDTTVPHVQRWRCGTFRQVTVNNHLAVAQLADLLAGRQGPCWNARRHARRRRWATVADWGGRIDDPQAQPEPMLLPDDLVDMFVVAEAAAGRVPVSRLTPAELPHLYLLWCQHEVAAGRTPGQKPFARTFGVTEWQARQIAHRAAQLDTKPNHSDPCRISGKVA